VKRISIYPNKELQEKLEYLSTYYRCEIGGALLRKSIDSLYDFVLSRNSKDFGSLDVKISHAIKRIDDLHLIESKKLYFIICNAYDKIDDELKSKYKNPKELFQWLYFKEIKEKSKTLK
jgi:hypothetical protein